MFELSLHCPQAQVEALADLLASLDAQSVSIEDADARTDAEQALFGEPGLEPEQIGWSRSRVTALFASEALAWSAARNLMVSSGLPGCEIEAVTPVPQHDWVRLTQAQFAPVLISPGFWIVPTWHDPPAGARQVIRLDPGLAFGTGTHPTTRMCLQWIAHRSGGQALGRVLDYGCGSGILAIAAAMHGALRVDAVDIDPVAVQAAGRNAVANGVDINCALPDMASGQYETVLANILATPLKVLAPLLSARLAPGGHLVLAGILERQADELARAYAPGLQLEIAASQEGWILMIAARQATTI